MCVTFWGSLFPPAANVDRQTLHLVNKNNRDRSEGRACPTTLQPSHPAGGGWSLLPAFLLRIWWCSHWVRVVGGSVSVFWARGRFSLLFSTWHYLASCSQIVFQSKGIQRCLWGNIQSRNYVNEMYKTLALKWSRLGISIHLSSGSLNYFMQSIYLKNMIFLNISLEKFYVHPYSILFLSELIILVRLQGGEAVPNCPQV